MKILTDIFPLKAQFLKNERVYLRVILCNPEPRLRNLTVQTTVMHLTQTVEEKEIKVSLRALETLTLDVELSAQNTDFEGFGADVSLLENKSDIESGSTAFDVASNWRKATRYGFLSEFGPEETSDADVEFLLKFHINLVQFYDWVYRHDDYIPPQQEYQDLMGKKHSLPVLKRKIKKCHDYGMKTFAYGAIYATSEEYYRAHEDSSLLTSSGKPYRFIDIFYIMNIASDSLWRSHIVGEYEKALKDENFDGIHIDTYGFPKSGISKAGENEREIYLDEQFPAFIREARARLSKTNPDCGLIFNNVCNWPVDGTAVEADAAYIEVWEPYERYYHIQQIILQAKNAGKGKPVILAAYLKPFREKGRETEAENAALLLTAAVAANGAYHLLLGEENGVLTQGYYPDHSTLRATFLTHIRRYYDFIVRYGELLFDGALRDVSMTHSGGDNLEYQFRNSVFSPYARPDSVWTVIRESRKRKVLNFINLTGNVEDYWNKGKQSPVVQNDIQICAEILKQPKAVYWVSSDGEDGKPKLLPYRVDDGERGKVLKTCLPELRFWSMVVIEF